MSFFRVKYLSFFFILISIFSFFNIIYSYYFNLYLNLNTYYFSLIISGVIGIIFYKIKTDSKKPSIFEKILTVLLGYFLMPLILSIPFYLSIYNLTFINSFFEFFQTASQLPTSLHPASKGITIPSDVFSITATSIDNVGHFENSFSFTLMKSRSFTKLF